MFLSCVASEMAMGEINSLSEKLETEQVLRREAEHIAHQVRKNTSHVTHVFNIYQLSTCQRLML